MGPTGVDFEPLVRLAAALSAHPAELVAKVRLAVGPELADLLESPEQLRRLTVQTLLRGRRSEPDPTLAEPLIDRVDALPRLERAILVLLDLEQLTRAEVAAIVDRPVAVVDQVRERAYAELCTDPFELAAGLAELSWRPVDPAEVRRAETALTRGRRRTTRRWGLLAAAVLVVIAAIVLPGVLRTTVPPPVFVRGHRDWVLSYRLTPPPDYQIDSRTVGADVETTMISSSIGAGGCQISVGSSVDDGGDDAVNGRPVTVQGRPARLQSRTGLARLRWSPADGLAADVSCSVTVAPDTLVTELAQKMIFEEEPILLPYRLGPLPSHFHVDQVMLRPLDGATVVDLWPDEVAPTGVPLALTQSGNGLGGQDGTTLATYGVCRLVDDVSVCVGYAAPGAPGALEEQMRTTHRVKMIKNNMIMATSGHDHSTWTDARVALPRE